MGSFTTAEQGHVAVLVPPQNLNSSTKAVYFSMENYAHATVVVSTGAVTNAATVTVFESDDGEGSNEAAIDFKCSKCVVDGQDVFDTLTWTSSQAGFSTGTVDNSTFIIEIDASQLAANRPWIGVKTTDPETCNIAIVAVLSGSRYAGATTPSVL